ncbi:MAG TPA: short-chain dehydrogenase [Colwellia sp.]|nr:short-chain dehydrogenase [Colwellia sp.]
MITQQTLIIGANSDIAKALALQLIESETTGLILISRNVIADDLLYRDRNNSNVNIITVKDYQLQSIEQAIEEIAAYNHAHITRIFICNGILHSQSIQPEKRIEELTVESFNQVMASNALTPMLWIQQLMPTLTGNSPCKIVVFSARVGSISDNYLGGWYSYRASKAALNMMLKTAAIEIARRNKNIKIIAFHPGTTDTPLSKPFQKNVPKNKLFTCDFVASQLLTIVENSSYDQTASYLDWQGKSINW